MMRRASLLVVFVILIYIKTRRVSSHFEGVPGDSDVFRNPNCGSEMLSRGSCNCAKFEAECVRSDCRECKCRKKARIYRSDVPKCLSDLEARDPWCRYQFLQTGPDIIPTIDLGKTCQNNKPCSQPINAPFDKTKSKCRVSWVDYLQNGTWHENPVGKFQKIFNLRESDYFAERGYMYRLEWKTLQDSYIPRRLFQVSLECLDGDSLKESYCLMFRVKGRGEPKLIKASETRLNTRRPPTRTVMTTFRPTRSSSRRRVNTRVSKIVVVSDNFAVILAAVAGAVGTALVVIPLAIFCRRNTRSSRKCVTQNCAEHQRFEEGVIEDHGTSEETLSSYTSLKRNRENEEPPSIYQSLNKPGDSDDELPMEEPIYISVSGDEDEAPAPALAPARPPPIYHVLEDLENELSQNDGV